jgi:glycosyltransferase involved in cell wall biosynthesis
MAAAVHDKITEAHFVIAGRGELEEELQQQAQRLGITEQVHFLGHVPRVRSLLPLLDVGVLTSESEGFSNALIEYSSAGVPAVTFDVGGNPEIIHDGVSGFLAPDGDVERLAELVVKLLSDNELRQRQAEAGRKLTTDLFDPERIMMRTMDFYQTIAAAGRDQARFDR